jgi:3-hydroxyacyl-[acyl-carrier-protein] dehydratase
MTAEQGQPAAAATGGLDIRRIMAALPHRYPLLLVDRVVSMVPNTSIHAIKAVSMNEAFFQGHFPGRPIMPGVLIVEALAQSGAVLMSKSLDVDVRGKTIFFVSVDNCRFRAPVRPGDVLRLCVEVVRARGDLFKFRGQAKVGEKIAAEAEFAAMVVETPA